MINLVRASSETERAQVDGFVRAYQEAFAGPPYNENYSEQFVFDEVWTPHIEDGMVILALDDLEVVGFGCALPVKKSPSEVQEHIEKFGHEADGLSDAWYMSELGVLKSHRLRGIGYALVKARLLEIQELGSAMYVFRTAAENSNSRHLYENVGATVLGELQSMADNDQVLVNGSQSTERVYLFGDCVSAIARIPVMQA